MSQSAVIVGLVLVLFVLWAIMRGKLPDYARAIGLGART